MAGALQSSEIGRVARSIRATAIGLIAALVAATLAVLPAAAVTAPTQGTLQGWGAGTTPTPAPLALEHVHALAAGGSHTVALTDDGNVYAWGNNSRGQVTAPAGGRYDEPQPVVLGLPEGRRVIDVAAGTDHSLALTDDGHVYAWGDNANGQSSCVLEVSTNACPVTLPGTARPTEVVALTVGSAVPAPLTNIRAIAAGARHNLAIEHSGRVWSWGDNRDGQLGNGVLGIPTNPIAGASQADDPAPTPTGALPAQVDAGGAHSLLRRGDGTVLAWGDNTSGQLAQNLRVDNPVPTAVSGLAGAREVAAGGGHSVALDAAGHLWTWGANDLGQLGDATTSASRSAPAKLAYSVAVRSIAAGADHTLAITDARGVVAWGSDAAGQLGDDTNFALKRTPTSVAGITTATSVSAGDNHSLALVAPAITFTTTLAFGNQEVAETSPASTITVTNNGPGPLAVTTPTISGSQFDIASDSCSTPVGATVRRDVPAGSSCTITVTFTPTNTGNRAATLTFGSNAVEPVTTIALSGTGTLASGVLRVTVDEPSVPPAPSSVATTDFKYQAAAPSLGVGGLPLGSLSIGGLGLGSLSIGGLGLGSLSIGGLGLGSLSIGGLPLGSLSIGGLGLGSLSIGGLGLGSLSIGPIPVTSVPLRADRVPGGWAEVLAGSQFDIRLLQDVTLDEILSTSPLPPGVARLTVGDIDWENSALADVNPMALVLGDLPASAVPIDWCPVLAEAGNTVCSDADEVSVLLLQLAGVNLPDAMAAVQLRDIALEGSPLWAFPLTKLDLQNTDFGAIKLRDLPSRDATVDCAKVTCNDTTNLADAGSAGALRPSATVGTLGSAVGGFTLAQATLALTPGVFLGEVPAERGGVLTSPSAPGLELLHYHLLLNPTGANVTSPTAAMTVSSSFRVAPGTSRARVGSSTVTVPDPVVAIDGDAMTLTWSGLPTIADGTTFGLDVAMYPGLVTGPFAVTRASIRSASATFTKELATPHELATANTAVTDGYFEPNDTVPTACGPTNRNQLTTGRIHYIHLSHRNDVEYLCFPAPATGAMATVDIKGQDLDIDAALLYGKDMPQDLPLRNPKTTSTALASIGDQPASLHSGATIGSENVDLPLPAGYGVADLATQRGPAAESVAAVSTGGAGFFIVQLTTHGGAISRKPVSVNLTISPLSTPPAPALRVYPFDASPYAGSDESSSTGTVPATIPADTKTLLLVNRNAVNDEYGPAAASALMTKLSSLVAFQGAANRAVVVGIDGDPAIRAALQAADAAPGDVALNNNVVRRTNDLVDRLVAASRAKIENIVLVGGPNQLRSPLVRDLTIQANERSFAGAAVKNSATNPLSAFLAGGYMPIDAAYCDFAPRPTAVGWRYVSTAACGRLVESPPEIISIIDRFIAKGGVLDLGSSATALAVGSDFMNDLAVKTDAVNESAFANRTLLTGEGWSDVDLQNALTGVRVASVNTHFDTTRALAPKSGSPKFTVQKLDGLLLPELAFVSSVGCHAGLSESDFLSTDPTKVRDWSQAFAAKGLTYAAPTTYGLGLSHDIGLHELLSKHLATNVAAMKASGLTIGQALAQAQQQYMGGRLAYGVYDDKIMSMGLYGLPLWKAAGAAAPSPVVAPQPNGDDPFTGLATTTIEPRPTFTRTDTVDGSFFAADGGTQSVWDRPIQPGMQFPVAASARGALITSLSSVDHGTASAPFNPVIARPQLSAATIPLPESQYISRFPDSLARVTTVETASGRTASVVYSPGQFLDGRLEANRVVGTQRLFPQASLQVLHAPAGDTDDVAPKASAFRAVILDDIAYFRVVAKDLTGTGANGTVKRVLLQMQVGTSWVAVDLTPGPGGVFTGAVAVPSGTSSISGFGQLVDASGNVGVFGPIDAAAPTALPPGVARTVTDRSVTVTAPLGVDVQLSVNGAPLADETGTFLLPDYDGLHVVDLVTSTGHVGTFYVVRDTQGPQIGIFRPANGGLYVLGSAVPASYFCRDAATPVASCTGDRPNGGNIDTSSVGRSTFTSTASDTTGHTATASTTYTIGYRFIGFAGIADEPALNTGNAGRSVPVLWQLQDGGGNFVGDPANPWAHVTGLTWYQVQCPGGAAATNPVPSNDAGSSDLRYDGSSGQYQFNWKTETSWTGSCRRFLVTTDDSVVHAFTIRFS